MLVVAYIVLLLCLINLLRMGYFSLASEWFDIRSKKAGKHGLGAKSPRLFSVHYRPLVTVIVPAHNEELTLTRNLESIAASDYKRVELIIVNDSSTDRTQSLARNFQRKYRNRFTKIKVINVSVRGKAKALNAGLKYASGSLFMCLDADSALTPTAISSAVKTFRDPSVGSLSANVKIFKTAGLLNSIQRIEYLLCYQMKKAETQSNIQYIVGGIGSMYRTRLIRAMKGYDTDTITEDIDLSMQLLDQFKGRYKIHYNPEVVVYTESVLDVPGLIKQRYRWKYGRYQVFLKRKSLFFGRRSRQPNMWLSWLYLPFALFSELTYLLEPLVITYLVYIAFHFGDWRILLTSFMTYIIYTVFLIQGATQSYSRRERLSLSLYAPVAFLGMYILSFVEYMATIKGLYNLPKLIRGFRRGDMGSCEWTHVARGGTASLKI